MLNLPKSIASLAFLSPALGWQAERRYQQLPRLENSCKAQCNHPQEDLQTCQPSSFSGSNFPSVSIIVPARNEAINLQRLLPSLCGLDYPGRLDVLVVDDNSEDDTAVIAQKFGVQVLSLDGLPEGWLGKPNACHRGMAVTTGDWVLFTDADTEHTSDGLFRAVQFALDNQLDGLTIHLGHVTNSWLDSITLLAAFAGLFAGLPRNHASMNGQYVLLRREVLARSGGFTAVRNEPLEDLALGRHLNRLGYKIPMLDGSDVAEVAMYSSHTQLWHGMSRMGAGSLRFAGIGSVITGLFITALMTPLLVLGLVIARRLPPHWLGLTWGTAVLSIWPWSDRFGSRWQALFAPLGALFVQFAAVWGLLSRLVRRGIIWKGRMV